MMTIHVHWCPGHGSANEPHQRWWKLSKLSSVASSRVAQAVSTSLPDREGAARPRPGQVGALVSAAVARRPQVHLGLVTGELGESAVLVLDGEAKPLPLKHGGFPQVLHGQGQDCPQEPHNRVCFSGRPLTDRVTVQSCGSSPSSTQLQVEAGAELFDEPPKAAATEQFLSTAGHHHLLFAYDDDAAGGAAAVVGMISGVETTHPDKGTELLLYELGVAPFARKRGVATGLVRALPRWPRPVGATACGSPSTWTTRPHSLPTAARARRTRQLAWCSPGTSSGHDGRPLGRATSVTAGPSSYETG